MTDAKPLWAFYLDYELLDDDIHSFCVGLKASAYLGFREKSLSEDIHARLIVLIN